ncbi:preprotein translocase subunit YajC [bacterium]|nr:preprotein translocase subunit YajC [bacterium]MDE7510142.1 preprotein translocase subunit YajC [Muribaculaceae bacterium]
MNLMTILLQQQEGGSSWSGMLMIIAMVVVFYFFMIRPQSKKQKEIKKAREAMQKGDKVVTAGGIFGTIQSINDATGTMMIEIAKGVDIKVSREQVYPVTESAPEKK